MSVTVVLTVATETGRAYPAGTHLAGYRATLQLADQSQVGVSVDTVDLTAPIEFPGIAAGSYMATVARLDAAGAVVAQSQVGPFDVPASVEPPPPVVGDAPAAISVSFK